MAFTLRLWSPRPTLCHHTPRAPGTGAGPGQHTHVKTERSLTWRATRLSAPSEPPPPPQTLSQQDPNHLLSERLPWVGRRSHRPLVPHTRVQGGCPGHLPRSLPEATRQGTGGRTSDSNFPFLVIGKHGHVSKPGKEGHS